MMTSHYCRHWPVVNRPLDGRVANSGSHSLSGVTTGAGFADTSRARTAQHGPTVPRYGAPRCHALTLMEALV